MFNDVVKIANFNSHAHVERDPLSTSSHNLLPYFNSHAHVERDGCAVVENGGLDNFNSHAHVERDRCNIIVFNDFIVISTHTLTWSVTPW